MTKRRLFKYLSAAEHAEKLISGQVLFRTLAYFRDNEDGGVRGDHNEGTSVFGPPNGLVIHNQTKGTTFTLPGVSFNSSAKQAEIFVACFSRSLNDRMRSEFKAIVCVEIKDTAAFCKRVGEALPHSATFPRVGGAPKIGHPVTYYEEADNCTPRWALPERIALAKLKHFAWQDEYRLAFSLTDAFRFENITTTLVRGAIPPRNEAEHEIKFVEVGDISGICMVHTL